MGEKHLDTVSKHMYNQSAGPEPACADGASAAGSRERVPRNRSRGKEKKRPASVTDFAGYGRFREFPRAMEARRPARHKAADLRLKHICLEGVYGK